MLSGHKLDRNLSIKTIAASCRERADGLADMRRTSSICSADVLTTDI